MSELAHDKPEARADRPSGGDDGHAAGTGGAKGVTSGERVSVWDASRAVLLCIALLGANLYVNVYTQLDDAHRRGEVLPPRVPIFLEATSAIAALLSFPVVWNALRLAPPNRTPILKLVAFHAAGAVAFSALHVGLMELLRWSILSAVHIPYSWSPAQWPYEFRKDAISYVIIAGAFWLLRAPGVRRPEPTSGVEISDRTKPVQATFDIRDGAAVWRVPTADILAVRAAGNYVEFLLADGRRPLMRAALSEIETTLVSAGLVRTHRSWLVNERRIRGLVAAGSGDFRLDLDGGVSVPLSRRFPEALARLRDGR